MSIGTQRLHGQSCYFQFDISMGVGACPQTYIVLIWGCAPTLLTAALSPCAGSQALSPPPPVVFCRQSVVGGACLAPPTALVSAQAIQHSNDVAAIFTKQYLGLQ